MISFLIPARNEIYLERTIRDILANCRGEVEILVGLDGYLPEPQIVIGDNRVVFYDYKSPVGHRRITNDLAKLAKGEFICKIDAHCAISPGFDVEMAAHCEPSWTVIPRMYALDITTWKPKLNKRTDYMYISGPTGDKPFRASYFNSGQPKNEKMIDETMACMGPCFFMRRDRFFAQGGCDEAHGGWGAQSVEVSLKAWLSGGALMVNKGAWFAHWFRNGGIGFPYEISGNAQERARIYSRDLWLNDKWPLATRKLSWLIEKFNPPTWEKAVPLSVIIPSYKDPFLHKTIQSLLENAEGDIEIIPVIDGYKVEGLTNDPRVKPVILEQNVGMRGAINAGVKASRGKYIMRSDEHCMFSRGFDRVILESIQDNWIVVPRRYALDPYKWAIMPEHGYIDYEKLLILETPRKFSSVKWKSRTKERAKIMLDETMAMQGSCWIMARSWWDRVIGELDSNGYGPHYQDTTEMLFKTWAAGGKLMINKNAWYAHKHKSFNRTHQYPDSKAIPEWLFALEKWLPAYEQVRTQWAI